MATRASRRRPSEETIDPTDAPLVEEVEPVMVNDETIATLPAFVEATESDAVPAVVVEEAVSPDLPLVRGVGDLDWDVLLETAELVAPVVRPAVLAEADIDPRLKGLVDRAIAEGKVLINLHVAVSAEQFEFMRTHFVAAAHLHGKSATVKLLEGDLPQCKLVNKRGRGAAKKPAEPSAE